MKQSNTCGNQWIRIAELSFAATTFLMMLFVFRANPDGSASSGLRDKNTDEPIPYQMLRAEELDSINGLIFLYVTRENKNFEEFALSNLVTSLIEVYDRRKTINEYCKKEDMSEIWQPEKLFGESIALMGFLDEDSATFQEWFARYNENMIDEGQHSQDEVFMEYWRKTIAEFRSDGFKDFLDDCIPYRDARADRIKKSVQANGNEFRNDDRKGIKRFFSQK